MIGAKEMRDRSAGKEEEQAPSAAAPVPAPARRGRRRGLQVRRLAARELRRQLPVAAACLALGALVRVGLTLGPGGWASYAVEVSLATVALVSAWLLGVSTLAPDAESGAQRFLVGLPLGGVKQLLARLVPAAGLAALVPTLFASLSRLAGEAPAWWGAPGLRETVFGLHGDLTLQAVALFAAGLLAGALTRNTLAAFALAPVLWLAVAAEITTAARALPYWPRSLPPVGALTPALLSLLALPVALRGELHGREAWPGVRTALKALCGLVVLLGLGGAALVGLDRAGAHPVFHARSDGRLQIWRVGGLGGYHDGPGAAFLDRDGAASPPGPSGRNAFRVGDDLLLAGPRQADGSCTVTLPGEPPLEFTVPTLSAPAQVNAGEGLYGPAVARLPDGAVWLVTARGLAGSDGARVGTPEGFALRSWAERLAVLGPAPRKRGDVLQAEAGAWALAEFDGRALVVREPLDLPPGLRPCRVELSAEARWLIAVGDGERDVLHVRPRTGGPWRRLELDSPRGESVPANWQRPDQRRLRLGPGERWLLTQSYLGQEWVCFDLERGTRHVLEGIYPFTGYPLQWDRAGEVLWLDRGALRFSSDGPPRLSRWGDLVDQVPPDCSSANWLVLAEEPSGLLVILGADRRLYRVDLSARRVTPAAGLEEELLQRAAEVDVLH